MILDLNVSHIFAKRLRGLRESVGLSQSDLAEKLGVSRGSISYYENESRVPDILFLEAVSEYFDVGINFLLGHSENQDPTNEDLGLFIGFSDEAIEKLRRDAMGYGEAVSALVESDHFEELFDIAEYFFLPLSFGSKPDFIDRGLFYDEFEYCAYQVSRIFAAMLLERKAEVVDFFYEKFSNSFSNDDIQKKDFLKKKRDKELARIKELSEQHESYRSNLIDSYDAEYNAYVQDHSVEDLERKQRFEKIRKYIASESKNGKVESGNGND